MKLITFALALAVSALAFSAPAFAGGHHRHHARHGACDGVHRCLCGMTAARKHGLPRQYQGHNLARADEWPEAFSRAPAPYVGGVVYQGRGPSGHAHVSTIVGLTEKRCVAKVYDDRGTHERDICKRGGIVLTVGGAQSP